MNKQEITSKIKEITETGAVCGVDVYVCLKGEEQGFYIEKMISMNSLKDRIRSIALEIINTQYLQDEVVYCDILDVIDNKKAVYVLEQSDEYKPFALLNDDSMDEVFNFDEKDIGNVLGFIYQQAYVGSRLQAKNNLRIIQKDNVFEIVDKEMLKIDKRGELLILDNTILVRNVKVLQDFFGFQVFVRNQAQSVISKLEELDIIGNIATLKEYQTGEKLTISKKLMKVKNSPVLAMDKDELINKIPLVPRYKNIIHIENGKIRTNTKKDVDNLMKLLNDDYVKSELTDMEYDSTSKTLLNSESQDE